jgi:phage major head subunit gpT-like protein
MTQWRSGIESNVAAPQENTLKSRGIKVLVNPWLRSLADDSGTDGGWFLLDTSRGIKPYAFYQRQPVKMTALVAPTDPNVFMNNQFIWGIDSRGAASETVWWLSLAATSESAYGPM